MYYGLRVYCLGEINRAGTIRGRNAHIAKAQFPGFLFFTCLQSKRCGYCPGLC